MVIVGVHSPKGVHYEWFFHDVITVGTASDNDLVLRSSWLHPHHATIHVDEGTFFVEAHHEHNTVHEHSLRFIGKLAGPSPEAASLLAVRDGKVELYRQYASFLELELEHYGDPSEIGLLMAVRRGDDPSRAVYADWLEEHGDSARAQLLHAQLAILAHPPGSPDHARLGERIYALHTRVPPGWGSVVERAPIDIGDARLCFRVGPWRGSRSIDRDAVVQIWVGDRHLTFADDHAYVSAIATAIERDCDALDGGVPSSLLRWGPITDSFTTTAARAGDDAVLTFAIEGEPAVVTQLEISELRDRVRRLLEILRSSPK